jgi:polyisoprenoid-binding protein YceI
MQIHFRWLLQSRRIAAAVLLFFASSLFAQEQSFELNPASTAVRFRLDDVLHTVRGTFKAKGGDIHFDPGSGTASGSFVVDATSGESGNSTRDHKMHKEILESGKFPEITFSPTKIVGSLANGSSLQVEGVFHIHGADHPLMLTVPIVMNHDELTAQFHFVVPYVAWGMKNPSTLFLRVSKEVNIDVTAVGRLTSSQK